MHSPKYARIERERRFLLDRMPDAVSVLEVRHITDRYIEGTSLRLRQVCQEGTPAVFKLTQKIPLRAGGFQQGFITNIYLSESEFALLCQLPALPLIKKRFSVPPVGIDEFCGPLQGLLLAEAEFDSPEAAKAFTVPEYVRAEVTGDDRFTGGRLVRASRTDLQAWLGAYGISLRVA